MSSKFPPPYDGRRATARDRRAVIATALSGIRNAHAFTAILVAVEDIVARYIGAETFALFEPHEGGWRAVITHGIDANELARLTSPPPCTTKMAVAWCPLRSGESTLGWLAIYRLAFSKPALDAFDLELVDALGPFVAVAFEEARAIATKPTIRPPSMGKLKTQ